MSAPAVWATVAPVVGIGVGCVGTLLTEERRDRRSRAARTARVAEDEMIPSSTARPEPIANRIRTLYLGTVTTS